MDDEYKQYIKDLILSCWKQDDADIIEAVDTAHAEEQEDDEHMMPFNGCEMFNCAGVTLLTVPPPVPMPSTQSDELPSTQAAPLPSTQSASTQDWASTQSSSFDTQCTQEQEIRADRMKPSEVWKLHHDYYKNYAVTDRIPGDTSKNRIDPMGVDAINAALLEWQEESGRGDLDMPSWVDWHWDLRCRLIDQRLLTTRHCWDVTRSHMKNVLKKRIDDWTRSFDEPDATTKTLQREHYDLRPYEPVQTTLQREAADRERVATKAKKKTKESDIADEVSEKKRRADKRRTLKDVD